MGQTLSEPVVEKVRLSPQSASRLGNFCILTPRDIFLPRTLLVVTTSVVLPEKTHPSLSSREPH